MTEIVILRKLLHLKLQKTHIAMLDSIINMPTFIIDSPLMAIAVLPLVMGIVSALSSIGGGIASSVSSKKADDANRRLLDARNDELVKEQYQGVLDDPGSKAYLNTLNENLRDTITGVENSAVSTGATHENTLAAKESANRVISGAMSQLLQREDAKRQSIIQQRGNLANQEMAMNAESGARNAQNWATTAGNVASAASMLGSAYLDGNTSLFGTKGSSGAKTTGQRLDSFGQNTHNNLMSELYDDMDMNGLDLNIPLLKTN